jgi:hypothetical protein
VSVKRDALYQDPTHHDLQNTISERAENHRPCIIFDAMHLFVLVRELEVVKQLTWVSSKEITQEQRTYQLKSLDHLWMSIRLRLSIFSDPDQIHLGFDIPKKLDEFEVISYTCSPSFRSRFLARRVCVSSNFGKCSVEHAKRELQLFR